MGLRLWNPGIIRGFQKWMEHHQVGPYGKIGTAGFFDLAFSQSDQKNFRRLEKSSHGQFRVSGLYFVQVSISSLVVRLSCGIKLLVSFGVTGVAWFP